MRKLLFASTALTVLSTGPVLADDLPPGGWYLGVSAGANWLDDTSAPTFFGGLTVDTEFDTGWAILGNVGYRWRDSPVRLEFELGYRDNEVDAVTWAGPAFGPGGAVTQFSVMANVLLDFRLGGGVSLSLGGGIGAADSDVDVDGTGIHLIVDGDDDWTLAYQGIAGLALELSDQAQIFAEYRYFANHDHNVVTFPPPFFPLATEMDLDNHTATVGFRFFLEPPPAPVAGTPPLPPVTSFNVYFQKKTVLTAEGHATVAEAADVLKSGAPAVTIEASGLGSGTDLGERRGAAVRRALVDLGVSPDKISVTPHADGSASVTATQ